jgi:hypothetical protein
VFIGPLSCEPVATIGFSTNTWQKIWFCPQVIGNDPLPTSIGRRDHFYFVSHRAKSCPGGTPWFYHSMGIEISMVLQSDKGIPSPTPSPTVLNMFCTTSFSSFMHQTNRFLLLTPTQDFTKEIGVQ